MNIDEPRQCDKFHAGSGRSERTVANVCSSDKDTAVLRKSAVRYLLVCARFFIFVQDLCAWGCALCRANCLASVGYRA